MLNYAWSPVCQVYLTFFGGTPTPIGDGCRSRFVSLADLDYELRLCGLVRKGGRSRGVIATDGALPPCARHVGLTLSAPPAQEAR